MPLTAKLDTCTKTEPVKLQVPCPNENCCRAAYAAGLTAVWQLMLPGRLHWRHMSPGKMVNKLQRASDSCRCSALACHWLSSSKPKPQPNTSSSGSDTCEGAPSSESESGSSSRTTMRSMGLPLMLTTAASGRGQSLVRCSTLPANHLAAWLSSRLRSVSRPRC